MALSFLITAAKILLRLRECYASLVSAMLLILLKKQSDGHSVFVRGAEIYYNKYEVTTTTSYPGYDENNNIEFN